MRRRIQRRGVYGDHSARTSSTGIYPHMRRRIDVDPNPTERSLAFVLQESEYTSTSRRPLDSALYYPIVGSWVGLVSLGRCDAIRFVRHRSTTGFLSKFNRLMEWREQKAGSGTRGKDSTLSWGHSSIAAELPQGSTTALKYRAKNQYRKEAV